MFSTVPDPLVDYGLPAAFHFSVRIDGAPGGQDGAFQEVSGLEQEMELETVACGGENRFVYQLPSKMKPGKLVLKRGVAASASVLVQWCGTVLDGGLEAPIEVKNLEVRLLDAQGNPTRSWRIIRAFPVKWQLDALNATRNEVAIETMELAYQYCQRGL